MLLNRFMFEKQFISGIIKEIITANKLIDINLSYIEKMYSFKCFPIISLKEICY